MLAALYRTVRNLGTGSMVKTKKKARSDAAWESPDAGLKTPIQNNSIVTRGQKL